MLALEPKLKGIRHLRLGLGSFSTRSWSAILPNLDQLEKLTVVKCNYLTDELLINLTALNPPLKSLALYFCDRITDKSLEALGSTLSHLTSLELLGCSNITNKGIKALNLPHLRELNLNCCKKIDPFRESPDGLASFFSQHVNLRRLDLNSNYITLTNELLSVLIRHLIPLEKLRILVLSEYSPVSILFISSLHFNLPQLTTLAIGGREYNTKKHYQLLKKIMID